MLTFERTRDIELVRSIVAHPRVYRAGLLPDYAPPREAYSPPANESIWYMIPKRNDVPLGVFFFIPQNPVWWEVHMALLPDAWGEATQISRSMARWLGENTSCRKLTASIPHYNRLALQMVQRIGMTHIGINAGSVLKDGQLHDQSIFGLEVKS